MTVSCGVNGAEIREAFLLNLNLSSSLKLTFSNGRLLAILFILVFVLIGEIAKGKATLGLFMVLSLPLVMILGFIWFRLARSFGKIARAISASGAQITIETRGITTTLPNGTRTFEPWLSYARWREGKLVFTVGNQKNYRTISKSALGVHTDELRSLLLSRICTGTR